MQHQVDVWEHLLWQTIRSWSRACAPRFLSTRAATTVPCYFSGRSIKQCSPCGAGKRRCVRQPKTRSWLAYGVSVHCSFEFSDGHLFYGRTPSFHGKTRDTRPQSVICASSEFCVWRGPWCLAARTQMKDLVPRLKALAVHEYLSGWRYSCVL